jgi:hypothetical protein
VTLFARILSYLPLAFGVIQHVEQTVQGSTSKQAKALDLVTTGLQALNVVDPTVLAHPQVQTALRTLNDAAVGVANIIASVQASTSPPR